jgi:hypothetical protein
MNEEIQNIEDVETDERSTGKQSESNAELDELRRENEALRSAAREKAASETITNELRSIGARSPELMFESIKANLQFDEAGVLLNTAAIVTDLKKRFPEQFGSAISIDAAAGAGARPNFLTPEMLARMKPEEIAKLDWAEVRSVLANN